MKNRATAKKEKFARDFERGVEIKNREGRNKDKEFFLNMVIFF